MSWFLTFNPSQQARLRLFCFPYAGGGASIYRQWPGLLPAQVEICPVTLPGREMRLREKAYTRLPPLVEALAEALLPALDKPFAFFGHSMGGLIAFETARALRRRGLPQPLHLFIAARPAPQLVRADPPLSHLPDAAFASELQRRYAGIPAAVLQDPELMALYLPILRADLELLETYHYQAEAPLDCPISTYGGMQDSMVTPDRIAPWQKQTAGSFSRALFPGGHFFLQSQQTPLLEGLGRTLAEILKRLDDRLESAVETGTENGDD
jgi:medium-chain acyl-[acyl-carrier-protein] hydrolase